MESVASWLLFVAWAATFVAWRIARSEWRAWRELYYAERFRSAKRARP